MNEILPNFVASLVNAISERRYAYVLIQSGTFIEGLLLALGIERTEVPELFWSSSLVRTVYDAPPHFTLVHESFTEFFETPHCTEVLLIRAQALVYEGFFDAAASIAESILYFLPRNGEAAQLKESIQTYSHSRTVDLTKESGGELVKKSGSLRAWSLKDALVCDKKGPVMLNTGSLVFDSSPVNFAASLPEVIVRKSVTLQRSDQVIPVQSGGSDNFWHWTIEQLPRVLTAQNLGLPGKFLVSSTSDFVMHTLAALGVELDRIHETCGGHDIRAAEVFFIEHPDYSPKHAELYRTIREKVVMYCKANSSIIPATKRLYVSRKGARVVVNEVEVEGMFRRFGFEVTCFDDVPFVDQVAMTSELNALAGPHGASLTHALYMQDGGNLLELFSPNYVNPCMTHVNSFFDHRYHMIVSTNRTRHYAHGDDVVVPLDVLELALKSLI